MGRSAGYVCRHCGYHSLKWLGRCPACEAWDAFDALAAAAPPAGIETAALPLSEILRSEVARASTGLAELDRVLGGGLVPGAAVLVGGEPGIGKSTLLLQAMAELAAARSPVLYLSGEESPAQLALRADRLGVRSADLLVAAELDVDAALEAARQTRPAALVVDSIQSVRCADIAAPAGSVSQVRESAARCAAFAKATATPVFLIGHVTKDGQLAGPRVLEHLVDVVLQFEGDRHHAHRLLRALKNRFGPADELGVFRMGDEGLQEVANPSAALLAERADGAPGSAVLAAILGSRPLLVEVQALVGPAVPGSPRRSTLGIDANRLAMVLAVLQRRAGVDLAARDVYINAAGGVSVSEPAADLAVALAVVSSLRQRPIPPRWVAAGEIGLTGEIRRVGRTATRLREAARLGFEVALVPGPDPDAREIEVVTVERVDQALERALGGVARRPLRAQIE